MLGTIKDKRTHRNKAAPNRKAFIDRYRDVLADHVKRLANGKNSSIKDIAKKREIKLPKRDLEEPSFQYDKEEGIWNRTLPGNKKFVTGDKIPIPGKGKGGNGAGKGDGEESLDEFTFTLTEDEFYDILFHDLELPDFIKHGMKMTEFSHMQRAGYTKEGCPCQLDLKKTFENAIARRIATREGDEEKKVPFLDEIDLRYRNFAEVTQPSRHAVMFCLLDVSGSMSEELKFRAKKYFLLLYTFLTRTYSNVEIVFIRHHDTASEVSEKDFFYAKETGGTTISSALELTKDIINERYNTNEINIYISQCSDGDNWYDDTEIALDLLRYDLLSKVQYYTYLEVRTYKAGYDTWHSALKHTLEKEFNNVRSEVALEDSEIFPLFRKLFKKS